MSRQYNLKSSLHDESQEEFSGGEVPSPPIVASPPLKIQMDPRCPLKKRDYPTSFCPMAVIRLKAIKSLDIPPTEQEEDRLAGCCWAINSQQANYCWHLFAKEYLTREFPPHEISHLLNIPEEDIAEIEESATRKFKDSEQMIELRKEHKDGLFVDAGEFPYHELRACRRK